MRFVFGQAIKFAAVVMLSLAVALTSAHPAAARPKFSSIVVDARDGSLLSADDADGLRHPASLTKMMTLYIVFQELKAGRIRLNTQLRVSKRAARMAPSKLGLRAGSTITVEQAIKALVIKSANDAAATVGENLAGGSESAFAARMTRVARSLGMRRTTFKNASGLPNPAQVTTARDMATLGLRLMRDYPQYYPYFRSTSFVFKGRVIRGHNRLVGRFPGTDGIKTGYVNASGYNLVTSTKRGGKRVVGVVMGATSSGRRNAHMMTIISRALPKADEGNTIAAVAGSSVGVINPLAKRQQVAEVKKAEAVPEDDKDLLAAVAAEASVDDKEEEGDGNEGPEVIEATLVETPKAKRKGEELTVSSLPENYTIQIGMFPTKAEAQSALAQMRMKNTDAYTLAVKKNGRTTYRVLISGVSAEAAKMSCAKATKLRKSCDVVNSEG